MAKEIERKFIVNGNSYREAASGVRHIVQAYLSREPRATVRVRIADDRAYLTVKGRNEGAVRDEWEYEIGVGDARDMIERCAEGRIIEKYRYIVVYNGLRWEIDEFAGDLKGLCIAEIELSDPEQKFELPPFVGEEVTGDPRYYNSAL